MDINEIMKKAQEMQAQMEKLGSEIAAKTYTGKASGGLVKITLTGENNAVQAEIDPSVISVEDKEMLEDLIVIAINDAIAQIDKERKDVFGSVLKG
ncbi:MAG: YbaB/EbfC family nucleoid-associated protein [Erysipelotrichaceae bacterium]|jgi:DNA-binding YbaB/EbfC family protein|nr:YbaB/EbfC family nucleoid-associated protein [Erysipelotrichaceae bacterium]MBQ1787982.1 YbaB/EbfC family nucleoid-associated protein [Erysipelotrichaceae bacterium]